MSPTNTPQIEVTTRETIENLLVNRSFFSVCSDGRFVLGTERDVAARGRSGTPRRYRTDFRQPRSTPPARRPPPTTTSPCQVRRCLRFRQVVGSFADPA